MISPKIMAVVHRSSIESHVLLTEAQITIMTHLPDICSLHNLNRVDKFLGNTFATHFTHIMPGVLTNSMPFDLKNKSVLLS